MLNIDHSLQTWFFEGQLWKDFSNALIFSFVRFWFTLSVLSYTQIETMDVGQMDKKLIVCFRGPRTAQHHL